MDAFLRERNLCSNYMGCMLQLLPTASTMYGAVMAQTVIAHTRREEEDNRVVSKHYGG